MVYKDLTANRHNHPNYNQLPVYQPVTQLEQNVVQQTADPKMGSDDDYELTSTNLQSVDSRDDYNDHYSPEQSAPAEKVALKHSQDGNRDNNDTRELNYHLYILNSKICLSF